MQAEQIAEYIQSQMPDASDVSVSNVARIPGGASRETWSFDARWMELEAQAESRRSPAAAVYLQGVRRLARGG